MSSTPVVVDRVVTPRGELVLRHDGEHYEVISNGTFLMDTRDGRSERLLVSAALDQHPDPETVLIGGLGVGFSAAQALTDDRVARVIVVEIEPAVVSWHRSHLARHGAAATSDLRCEVVVADVIDHLTDTTERYDVICLDVDNGPGWTVTDANAALYDDAGTTLLASRLRPGGILSVWSAARVPAYQTVLGQHFEQVEVHEVAVARGEPDIVMVGKAPIRARSGVRRRDGNRDCS